MTYPLETGHGNLPLFELNSFDNFLASAVVKNSLLSMHSQLFFEFVCPIQEPFYFSHLFDLHKTLDFDLFE